LDEATRGSVRDASAARKYGLPYVWLARRLSVWSRSGSEAGALLLQPLFSLHTRSGCV
jgi:hypothetical protein